MSREECVVVTGGSAGIGRACVEQALAAGRRVYSLDVKPTEASGGETFIETDLRQPAAIERAFAAITAEAAIVGLVNNAGVSLAKSLEETEPADFEKVLPVNLVAPALCARLAAESMKAAGWGRIVNVTSRVALGKELRSVYAAAKGGLTSMTRVWALELAPHGITVNSVGPGPIATELFRAVNPEDSPRTKQIIDSVPVGRLGTPEDVANLVLFFLKRGSGFVTGQTIYCCGGLTVGLAG